MNDERVASELLKIAKELTAGSFRKGIRNGEWVVTQYNPVWFDELGSAFDGYAKVVNQDTGESFEMQHDHALRSPIWWASVGSRTYKGTKPKDLFLKITEILA